MTVYRWQALKAMGVKLCPKCGGLMFPTPLVSFPYRCSDCGFGDAGTGPRRSAVAVSRRGEGGGKGVSG